MKNEAEIKELLISNAIRLIAEGGFEKATSKELAFSGGSLPGIKMNEVYIYRIFGGKENLYEAAFLRLDEELFQAFKIGLSLVDASDLTNKEKIFAFLEQAWSFILRNEIRCRCYVRYYFSVYFRDHSVKAHNETFGKLIKVIAPAFKEEADVEAILHSAFITLFDFGIRVFNGALEDNELNRPHIFNVIYCMMSTYFKSSLIGGEQ